MPLNTDPDAMSDDEYGRRRDERIARAGDSGLHTIPADELAAAYARLEANDGEGR